MRISILFLCSLSATSTALSIPLNDSLLQLPSTSPSKPPVNTTSTTLGDWPPTPYTVYIGSISLTFHQYGRRARPEFRPNILRAIEICRNHFWDQERLLESVPIYIASGIVEFTLWFHGLRRMSGEDLWLALLPLQLKYQDPTWSLHEIVSAEIGLGAPDYLPTASFRIAFSQL